MDSSPKLRRGRSATALKPNDTEEKNTSKVKKTAPVKASKRKQNGIKVEDPEIKDENGTAAPPVSNDKQVGIQITPKIEPDDESESPKKRQKKAAEKTDKPKKKTTKAAKKKVDDKIDNDKDKNGSAKDGKKSVTDKSTKKNGKSVAVERKAVERILVKKGSAAVDGICPIASNSHILEERSDIWDCMLNQTNIQFNNNKYYLIQLLKDDNKNVYSVWMRWGRVGCNGQNCLKPFGFNLDAAKTAFMQKFYAKTLNEWEFRSDFQKVPGKYDLLQMDYSDTQDTVDSKAEADLKIEKEPPKESKLEERLKALIELICDVKAMERAVTEMKFDAQKAPLGKLTPEQVKSGYKALKRIEDIITGDDKSNKNLLEACNAFYTRIPHYFGMKVPPLIRTKVDLQEKVMLLQTLSDIEAAMNIINQPLDVTMHPVDQHYHGLECDISALQRGEEEFMILEKYMKSTHGKTHTMYTIDVVDIFKVTKSSEKNRFNDIGNKMLLWHGSRLANWAGIMSQGLKIAPPEAPVTGYMFGKGIYFADMASKSANYCMPSYKNKTGLLILCEVALGKSKELLDADYDAHKHVSSAFRSVKALGRISPDPKNSVNISGDVVVPMGPPVETKVNNNMGYTLQYNEYIVYDVAQVKMKYLLKVNFNMK